MARLEGIEPPTCGLEIRCSIQLSYRRWWDATFGRLLRRLGRDVLDVSFDTSARAPRSPACTRPNLATHRVALEHLARQMLLREGSSTPAAPAGTPRHDYRCESRRGEGIGARFAGWISLCDLYPPATLGSAVGGRWSGREDLNLRHPAPKAGALPGCATPRCTGWRIGAKRYGARRGCVKLGDLACVVVRPCDAAWCACPRFAGAARGTGAAERRGTTCQIMHLCA